MLHRMAIFFADASQRIAQLYASAKTEVDLRSAVRPVTGTRAAAPSAERESQNIAT